VNEDARLEERLLAALARREYSRTELARKARGWGYPEEGIEAVLDRLVRQGSVDDGRVARDHVETRLRGRPRGRMALRAELRRRGVRAEAIDAALEAVGSEREEEAAREVTRRKLRSLRGREPELVRRRLAGALQRRGFPAELIRRILEEETT